jgi:putative ABC transport system substrate-binding protein
MITRDRKSARRKFLCGATTAALWPLVARAQPSRKVHRIGFMRYPSPQDPHFAMFQQGLRDLGYTPGRDILIEERYARGRPEQLPLLAAELARLNLDLVVVDGTPTALAAKQAMGQTPIVFVLAADPVRDGLAESLARPGGNLTGLTFQATDLTAKRLQLLKEAIPGVARVGVLYNPRLAFSPAMLSEVKGAGRYLGLQIEEAPAERPEALAGAFAAAARVDALLTLNDGMFFAQRARIVELTLQHRLPALHPEREYVEAGGLMSYGPSLADLYRRAAAYVDKVLNGAKPGDLPIQQPTRFELIVNLKTAKALGRAIPETIPLRADEVIE